MASLQLSVDMKLTIGLLVSFVILTVVGSVGAVGGPFAGPNNVDILLGLLTFVPILAGLLFFCWKRKLWAYAGSIILGVLVVIGTPLALPAQMSPLAMWENFLGTVLGILMAVEGFKAYSEVKRQ